MHQNTAYNLIIILLAIWTIPWKIYSVWIASKNNHKLWFVALIIFNTFGILEIFYVFYVAKKKIPEVKKAFIRALTPKKKVQ